MRRTNRFLIERRGAFDWKYCQSGKHFSQNKNHCQHRRREIAKKLGPLGVHWSCNSRANLDYDTIKSFKDNGLRLFLVGYESGNDETERGGADMLLARRFESDGTFWSVG